jgi:predicted DNA-binding transcriptional regulator AlpA
MNQDSEIFLTASEAMQIMNIKHSTFHVYAKQGILPRRKIGRQLRFAKSEKLNVGL